MSEYRALAPSTQAAPSTVLRTVPLRRDAGEDIEPGSRSR